MQGDFSRLTFNRERHYSAVLMQQGRVQVDADWNEQQALTRYRAETEAADVIGRCGGPIDNAAFGVLLDPSLLNAVDFQNFQNWCRANNQTVTGQLNNGDFILTAGRYYADGILCESETPVLFTLQPDYLQKPLEIQDPTEKEQAYAIYLDVWHRHITALDDDHIREKALGSPDTASRAKVVWQVKAVPLADLKINFETTDTQTTPDSQNPQSKEKLKIFFKPPLTNEAGGTATETATVAPTCENVCPALKDYLTGGTPGTLAAQTMPTPTMDTPCQLPPTAGYARLENQLYRVEIHQGGAYPPASGGNPVTFKWSRDNGTVVTAITKLDVDTSGVNTVITVKDVGPDDVLGFATGQWVELLDDSTELNSTPSDQLNGATPGDLVRITGVSAQLKQITVAGNVNLNFDSTLNPKLRRWDQIGTVDLPRGVTMDGTWQNLEGGVQVQFSNGVYNTGDYWLIPARTATGDIEWPRTLDNSGNETPNAIPPIGIKHHYCCLAIVSLEAQSVVKATTYIGAPPAATYHVVVTDCRCRFPTLCQLQEAAAELQPCVKVTQVNYGNGLTQQLVNGSPAGISYRDLLNYGIQLTCDQTVDQSTISRATAFVTLELPFPEILFAGIESMFSHDDSALKSFSKRLGLGGRTAQVLGYQPLVLPFNPPSRVSNTNLITLQLDSDTAASLALFISAFTNPFPILARLTLKGNFIWSDKDSTMCLDGEAFGTTDSSMASGIQLPSGDGRRGGDFEMYFHLGDDGSQGGNVIYLTKTSKFKKYVVANYARLKHEFSASVSKNAFIQKFGPEILPGGGTVADALNILPGNPSFNSVDAIPDVLARTEAKSLQTNLGNAKILKDSFGTSNVAGNIGDVAIENMTAIPDNIRKNLSAAGISTVDDLASASPTIIKQTAATLAANGFNLTSSDLAGYAGLAKILVKLP